MKHIEKASDRLMRQLKAIDTELIQKIVVEMLGTYGVQPDEVRQLPKLWRISHEKVYSQKGTLICGAAQAEWPTFYLRGLLRRKPRVVPFELLILHTYCHEMFHYLGLRVIEKAFFHTDEGDYVGVPVEFVRFAHGLQIDTTFKFQTSNERAGRSTFHSLNEGVTEILGRTLFSWYVRRVQLRNVSKAQIASYLVDLEVPDTTGFYASAVKFVRTLVTCFAKVRRMSPEEVFAWLVKAYVAGTDLEKDSTWNGHVEGAELPMGFTAWLKYAREKDLEEFREKELVPKLTVNPVFGHAFDDIVVVEEDETH